MRTATSMVIGIMLLAVGCASKPDIKPDAMVGRPLAEVEKNQQLDRYVADPWINLPPDGPAATTYFLDEGNLELWHTGNPAIVTKAIYLPSDKSTAERLKARDVAYQEWLKSRDSR